MKGVKIGVQWLTLLLTFASTSAAYGQALNTETPRLVDSIARQLVAKNKPKIATLDFTDIQGRPNELGRFLAEQVSIDMVGEAGITVVDRAHLTAIMAELKLTAAGLVDPENAKRLGKFAGVDAIVVGNLTALDGSAILNIRAVSTETAELVAAARMQFELSTDMKRMLGLAVTRTDGSPNAASESALSGSLPGASAVVGPVTALVRSVSAGFIGERNRRVPEIRVAIEFQNHNLNAAVAVAVNSQVVAQYAASGPTSGVIFGSLQDPVGSRWILGPGKLQGLPTLAGFETVVGDTYMGARPNVIQNAPSSVVDYVKRGVEYTGGGLPLKGQRLWMGSFVSIEAGGSIQWTATFSPTEAVVDRNGRIDPNNFYQLPSDFVWPESVNLSIELALGTLQDGERGERARDLALRNLVINRLGIPKRDQ